MDEEDKFQGVVCCSLHKERNFEGTIRKLLDLRSSSAHRGLECFCLDLKNKYYRATIHLLDHDKVIALENPRKILEDCYGIILLCDGQKTTTDQLNEKLEQLQSVRGEPRILLYDGIDEDCTPYETLRSWSLKNGYDLIDICDETAKIQVVDSLSAYKWTHRSCATKEEEKPQLNDEMLKKLADFDSLLGKLSAYREKPEMRGNPNDKNIEEIAEILSGLLGDDVDNFLDNEEPSNNDQGRP